MERMWQEPLRQRIQKREGLLQMRRYKMGKKRSEEKTSLTKRFFCFDRSRWTIFLVLLLLLPAVVIYGASPCGLLRASGPAQAVCWATYPTIIFIILGFVDVLFYGYLSPLSFLSLVAVWLVINSITSLVLSRPINSLYRRLKRK